MRKFLFILAALLSYLVLTSKSCGGPEENSAASEEVKLAASREQIKAEFESDALSVLTLRAFEEKAGHKLADLADYLNLYTDPLMDSSFREQARQMILDLFISDTILIDPNWIAEPGKNDLSLAGFLDILTEPDRKIDRFVFDSVLISTPLHLIVDHEYRGTLSFIDQHALIQANDTMFLPAIPHQAEILVRKTTKVIGHDTLQVWGVFLGSIQ